LEDEMTVLIAYASRHGATAGIAERIADDLRDAGLPVEIRPVDEVDDAADYDAFVIGGAAYMFHWLKDATHFAKRNRAVLDGKPVWLFSSGPLGTDLVDDQGRDVLEASRPKEFDQLAELLHPRGEQVFFGAWDPESPAIGVGERMFRAMPKSKEMLPAGDFRDWDAIDGWAREIAEELRPPQ
jgi:menaquinone-dependent protoporphyrinogen oxidase